MILIRHHHYTTITEILLVLILLTLAQAKNGLDGGQLLILIKLLLADVLDVKELTTKRKDAEALTSHHIQTANCRGCC